MSLTYGREPEILGEFSPDFHEYMHYMYLPIRVPSAEVPPLQRLPWGAPAPSRRLRLERIIPRRLHFAIPMVEMAMDRESREWDYIYLTARRGFATPGNPLNRPGWHADGFGSEDINYVWTDRFPTLFAVQDFEGVSEDHISSIAAFEAQVRPECVRTYGDRLVMRLDPTIIHAAPEIPAPGGERSFLKVSFSDSRYNLIGNSRNYSLDYDWEMYDRATVRNDPARAGSDAA